MSPLVPPTLARADDNARRARFDLRVTLLGLALLVLWEVLGRDLPAARAYGTASGFALRDAWLTSTLMHQGGRILGWCVLGFLAVDAWLQLLPGPTRAERLRWLAACVACLLFVPLIKHYSRTSCPWDLAEFGGIARYVPHWLTGVSDGGPGHCFPSGHAVAAFAFFSGYFLLRRHAPTLARIWLGSVLGLGLAYGWAQLARGAHYPSHTLWSAWLCWVVCQTVARLPQRTLSAPAF
ncbi:MAG: phosphatase PAP2 family protein [Burkholderiaceae bacterium]